MARAASTEEAAAIAAAIDRFRADTAGGGAKDELGPWRRAALIEGVGAKEAIANPDGKGGPRWLS
jgi:hypothetical protein